MIVNPTHPNAPLLSEVAREAFVRDGFIVVRGLLPRELALSTGEHLLQAMGVDLCTPATWAGKNLSMNPDVIRMTEACRTEDVERVAEELCGPHFRRGESFSPYLESQGVANPVKRGFIPVLAFPTPGPQQFVAPQGYHIDGMHRTTLWPQKLFLVLFAYLSDVEPFGGATTVLPGSHRQVFEHWFLAGHPGSTQPPQLNYAAPLPVKGRAGDIIFMHYLTVHSGSSNRSQTIRVGLNSCVLPNETRPYTPKSGPPQPDWTPLDYTLRTDTLYP